MVPPQGHEADRSIMACAYNSCKSMVNMQLHSSMCWHVMDGESRSFLVFAWALLAVFQSRHFIHLPLSNSSLNTAAALGLYPSRTTHLSPSNPMEYIDELENMASALCDRPELEADDDTVAKWQKLFGYSASEATKQLREHRACILPAVSTEHWQLVCCGPLPPSTVSLQPDSDIPTLLGTCREGGSRIRQGGL